MACPAIGCKTLGRRERMRLPWPAARMMTCMKWSDQEVNTEPGPGASKKRRGHSKRGNFSTAPPTGLAVAARRQMARSAGALLLGHESRLQHGRDIGGWNSDAKCAKEGRSLAKGSERSPL